MKTTTEFNYTQKYYDIESWKLKIDTSSTPDFSILDHPLNAEFYLKNLSYDIAQNTAKCIELFAGKIFKMWTLTEHSHLISTEVIEHFKHVFRHEQSEDGKNYWEREEELINIEILQKYIDEIRIHAHQIDQTDYGYMLLNTTTDYDSTRQRASSGHPGTWNTYHTFDKNSDQREFIKYEIERDNQCITEWIPIEDRKLYIFENPRSNRPDTFLVRKCFPEEARISQYNRLVEFIRIARKYKLPITTQFHTC
jgi:hypothetical protein